MLAIGVGRHHSHVAGVYGVVGDGLTWHGPFERFTRSQLRTILFDYIEVFYNRQRHQARLGHRTPAAAYAASKAA